MLSDAFDKRIKRRVIARNWPFFVVTAPYVEDICGAELQRLFSPSEDSRGSAISVAKTSGGAAFEGKLTDLYRANLFLGTANRILMRISEFKATGFGELSKKIGKTDWELFLPESCLLDIQATSRKSRLINSDAIRERFLSVISEKTDITTGQKQTVYVRAVDDVFTVSLNSSGDILYKRGVKTAGGKAPIRETLARAILLKSGYEPGMVLCDPMTGSGAFAVEAAMMTGNIPPGWFRNFAFMDWPAFRNAAWEHMRKEAAPYVNRPDSPVVFSSDTDKAVIRTLENIKSEYGFESIQTRVLDFFDLSPGDMAKGKKGLVVLNPPYGLRLSGNMNTTAFYNEIFKKLSNDFKGWKAAIIYPEPYEAGRSGSSPLNLTKSPLFHGGLNLTLLNGIIR